MLKGFLWIILSVLIGFIIWSFPTPEGLTIEGHKFLALLASLIVLFVKEMIPLPITMAAAASFIVLLNISEINFVFSAFADPVVFFVLGCLMLANIADHVGLTNRLGNFLLKHCGNNVVTYSFFSCLLFGLASAFMHDVSSVTIGLISLLPLMRAADIRPGSNTGKFLVISMAFCCSAGGMGTLVGGGRNMVAVTFLQDITGTTLSFFDWMIHALPPAIAIIPIIWFTLYLYFKPDKTATFPTDITKDSKSIPFNRDEKWTLVVILPVFTLFLTARVHGLHYAVITLLAVFALAALGIVNWDKMNDEVSWAVALLIFGGGIVIGRVMQDTGAAGFIADSIYPIFEGRSWFTIFLLVGILGSIFSQVMANVASASLILPITLPIALQMGINPAIIALSLGMFTSFAYLLVIGCPPNAIAFGFGYFTTTDLLKAGFVTQIVATIALALISLGWWHVLGILI